MQGINKREVFHLAVGAVAIGVVVTAIIWLPSLGPAKHALAWLSQADLYSDHTHWPAQGVELVGQIGGVTKAVAVQGNYAYIGVGLHLVILDVTDPTHPAIVGQTGVLPELVEGVAVSGNYAYVADRWYGGLCIIDVSDKAHPTKVGFYDTPGWAVGVAVAGNYAYVADWWGGLRIINVSNPAHPTEAGFYDTSGYAKDVAVAGNYAYVADDGAGLRIINISAPAHPTEVGYYDPWWFSAKGVAVAGNYAYVAGSTGLHIINVSDPAHPIETDYYSALSPTEGVAVSGNYAYVADFDRGLLIIDVSDPAHSTVVSYYDTPGWAVGVAVAGNYAYVADGESGLRIINVSDKAHPTEVGSYDPPGYAGGVAVAENYAYVAVNPVWDDDQWDYVGGGLRIINVSDPANPTEAGFYDTPGYAEAVAVSGNYAYVADSWHGGLCIIDVSDKAHPTEVGSYDMPGSAEGVAVSGNYAYVANGYTGLRIINVSDKAHPTEVGFYDTPGSAQGVAVSGNYAYVADSDRGLRIIDVSDPAAPTEAGYYDTPGYARGVAVAGNYAYVADEDSGLRIINVSNPAAPTETGFYNTPGWAYGVAVAENYAYVADWDEGLRVINVTDPAAPLEAGFYDTPGSAVDVAVAGNYTYVADEDGGLFILRFTGGVDTTPPTVISTYPEDGATSVAIDTVIAATFSEPMDSSTINTDSFTLAGSAVAGTVTYDPDTYTAVFTPDADLDYDHEYTASLSTAITDEAGNPLAEPYTWSFTTEAAPGPQVDIRVEEIIPIQVIEGVPLVKDKATMVRCFVKLEEIEDLEVVEAQAEVDFGGDRRPPIRNWFANFKGKTYAFPTAEEANDFTFRAKEDPTLETTHWFKRQIQFHGIDSINLDFPNEPFIPSTAGDLRIWVEVVSVGVNDADMSNNALEVTTTVKPMKENLKILFQRAQVSPQGGSFRTTTDDFLELAQSHFGFLVSTYPLAQKHINERYEPSILTYLWEPVKWFIIDLNIRTSLAGYWKGVYVVPDDWLGEEGKSFDLCKRAVLISEESSEDTTAHEIGHTYELDGLADTYQRVLAADGWDVNHSTVGGLILGPGKICVEKDNLSSIHNFYDFMPYGAWPLWISRDHYRQLMNNLISGGSDPRLLLVSGILFEDGTVELGPFYVSSGVPDELAPGSYSFETVAADSSMLGSTTFEPVFDATGCCPFAFAIPYPEGTERLILKRDGVILSEAHRTPHSPVVTISPAENLGDGRYRVEWETTDADADKLEFLVYYSHNGQDWFPLSVNNDSVEFDSSLLPGGDGATIKVIATDGMNTVEGLSAPFSVPTKAPTASVMSPLDDSYFVQGSMILAKGFACDPEDSQLTGSSLVWASDIDGVLGQGNVLYFSNLSLGNHRISLTATDSEGKTATASIQITVYPPGPDIIPPATVTDLVADNSTTESVILSWTAPGDDGNAGIASTYDIRYSTWPITEDNWDSASQCAGEPAPQPAGSSETFIVTGLSPGTTYYFALKAADEIPNWPGLSNVPSGTTQPGPDTTPPSIVTDLVTANPTTDSITLNWTAPADDGNTGIASEMPNRSGRSNIALAGTHSTTHKVYFPIIMKSHRPGDIDTASEYDIRYSTSPITDDNWDADTTKQCVGEPAPQPPGSRETFTCHGLAPGTTYYFALKTADEVPNWSGLSNVALGTTLRPPDTIPPATVTNLRTTNPTLDSMTLNWTAPGDDGNTGTASQYDIRYSTSPITDASWNTATQCVGEPAPQPAGSSETLTVHGLTPGTTYYFALKTADEVPNWSGLSNVASGATLRPSNQLIINCGFETDEAWVFGESPRPAAYTTEDAHWGARSVRLGIKPPTTDAYSWSSVRQRVTIPANAASATLSFWYKPFTECTCRDNWQQFDWSDFSVDQTGRIPPSRNPLSWASCDWQQAFILADDFPKATILATVMNVSSNSRVWTNQTFDLMFFRGQTVWVYFNVYNDGWGNRRTWMYLDDVSVMVYY